MFGIFKSAPTRYHAHYQAELKVSEGSNTEDRVNAMFDALKKSEENSDYLVIEAKTDAMARTRARHAITFRSQDLNTPLEFVALYKEGKKNGQHRLIEISI